MKKLRPSLHGKTLYRYFKKEIHKLFISSVILSVVEFSFIIAFPMLLSLELNGASGSSKTSGITSLLQSTGLEPGPSLIAMILGLLTTRTLVVSWIKYFQNKLIAKCKVGIESHIFLNALSGMSTEYSPSERAQLLNLLTKETEILAYEFAVPFFGGLGEAVIVLFATIALFVLSPTLALLCALLGSLTLIAFIAVNKKIIGQTERAAFRGRHQANYFANQALSCISEIRLYGLENKLLQEFSQASLVSAESLGLAKAIGMMYPMVLEFLVYSILCFAIVKDASFHQMGNSVAFWWIGFGAFRIMPSLSRILIALSSARYAFPSLIAVNQALEKSNSPEALKTLLRHSPHSDPTISDSETLKPLPLQVNVQGLTFKYPNQSHYIVDHLNFSIQSGSVIGLVGTSGAGKSTFARLILGLIRPEEGKVAFQQGSSEVENPSDCVAMVSANSLVLGETIRDNVMLSSKAKPDDRRIAKALFDGGFQFDLSSPSECSSLLQRNIASLSSGQFQRVMIARALYSGRRFLVLDEATAMLDNDTQALVTDTIKRLKGEYTILVIAHRKEALASCDSVYQLQQGGQLVQVM